MKYKRHATKSQTISMVKKCLVGDAASAAMDGAAPDLGQDDPLREKRHTRGTADINTYERCVWPALLQHCLFSI